MAIKSLSITEDAYEALKAIKLEDESFSDVILRLSQEKVGAAAKFFGIWKNKSNLARDIKGDIKKRHAALDKELSQRQEQFFGA